MIINKFTPPHLVKTALRRERLLTSLAAASDTSVIYIYGPAGYGKTILALQYMEVIGRSRCAWVNLDENDNDLAKLSKLLYGIVRLDAISESIDSDGFGIDRQENDQVGQFDNWLVYALTGSDSPDVIFLDDFEKVNDQTILDSIESAFKQIPVGKQVVVLSRRKPEFELTELLLRDRISIVGPEELKFNWDECSTFISVGLGSNPTPDQMQSVYDETDGWPAALKLCSIALNESKDFNNLFSKNKGRESLLVEYLLNNILNNFSDDVVRFMLLSSCLKEFNKESYESISGQYDFDQMVGRLTDGGLLHYSYGKDDGWYRYHPVLANFLYDHFMTLNEPEVKRVHVSAAHWHSENNKYHQAIFHSLQAGNLEFAGSLMDGESYDQLVNANLNTILKWSLNFTDSQLMKHQNLLACLCWSYIFLRDKELFSHFRGLLSELLERERGDSVLLRNVKVMDIAKSIFFDEFSSAEKYLESVSCDSFAAGSWDESAFLNCQAYSYIMNNEFERARQSFVKATAYREFNATPYGSIYIYANHAASLLIQAKFDIAGMIIRDCENKIPKTTGSFVALHALIPPYAEYLYETNRLDEADKLLTDSLPLIRQFCPADWLMISYFTLSRIKCCKGDATAALRLLQELEKIGYAEGIDRLVVSTQWEMVRLYTLNSDVLRAKELSLAIKAEALPIESSCRENHPEDIEADTITECRLKIYKGDASSALELLQDKMVKNHPLRSYRLIKLKILSALACDYLGDVDGAVKNIKEAVHLSAGQDVIRSFLDEDKKVIDIVYELRDRVLKDTSSKTLSGEYKLLDKLLSAAGRGKSVNDSGCYELIESLTSRELQILNLIEKGYSNRVISKELSVTESTVKYHLSNIYSKLGVKKRTQAILKGRQIGLLG